MKIIINKLFIEQKQEINLVDKPEVHGPGGNIHEHQGGEKEKLKKLKFLEGPYDRDIIISAGDTSELRKRKLKTQLMDESQKAYQNGLKKFSDGISLLSVNSSEISTMA